MFRTFLNEHRFSPFQWLIFALCFVIVLLDGFDTAADRLHRAIAGERVGCRQPALAPVLECGALRPCRRALLTGPLADRFGRKRLLVASVLSSPSRVLPSASAADLTQLTAWRFRYRCRPGRGDA